VRGVCVVTAKNDRLSTAAGGRRQGGRRRPRVRAAQHGYRKSRLGEGGGWVCRTGGVEVIGKALCDFHLYGAYTCRAMVMGGSAWSPGCRGVCC